jgi:hypothetical protein
LVGKTKTQAGPANNATVLKPDLIPAVSPLEDLQEELLIHPPSIALQPVERYKVFMVKGNFQIEGVSRDATPSEDARDPL